MRKTFLSIFLSSLLLLSFSAASAQNVEPVSERNVRAEMYFLAGDAMQGRGSGTKFERIAAEYIGSMFMQFGLEPAGEIGFDGKPTFVQTIQAPIRETLTGLSIDGTSIKLGDDLIAFAIAGKEITGPIQHAKLGDKANKGAIVVVSMPADTKFENAQGAIRQMSRDGAAAVIMVETQEIRANWAEVAGRKATLGRFGTLLAVSTKAHEELAKIAEGASITLKGTFESQPPTYTWNAIGKITGTDATLGSQVILISSHLDHLASATTLPVTTRSSMAPMTMPRVRWPCLRSHGSLLLATNRSEPSISSVSAAKRRAASEPDIS
ncbi:MAG: peptidase M28 [Acidobacteria bacterium OLB17]|nr:MAG: peptidase M28 [Acidobacteria bacterium OLB17]